VQPLRSIDATTIACRSASTRSAARQNQRGRLLVRTGEASKEVERGQSQRQTNSSGCDALVGDKAAEIAAMQGEESQGAGRN
jgi:hypothetical protein